ncbi:testis-expressed protein 264-like [Lingula anatina]|uniref:Testis-expressed protein 264-like n=1 Tax=Lingula anatina TaxID=7574 RepID=A0A1S3HFR0_LINAN|nr:testis-expressed protein 264-like [Lingula anatina]|eukprot:XP_013383874.1 testis-expressed protein 264-like [Lingula anatina]
MSTEMLLLYGLFCLIVAILLTVLGFLVYSGLFADIVVGAGPPPVGKLYVAYKFGKGSYKDAGYLFTEAVSIVADLRCIGVYYDDPDEVGLGEQRYVVGSILAEGDKEPDPAQKEEYQRRGYKFHTFPAVTNVVKTKFPYNTAISILVAIKRVYPVLGQYVKEKRLCAHPFVEIYDGFTIHFMAPLAKQDEFYVPEAHGHTHQEGPAHLKDSPKHKKTADQREDESQPVKVRRSKRSGSPSRSLDKTPELSTNEEDSGITSANISGASAGGDSAEAEQSCNLDSTGGTSYISDVTTCTEDDSVVSGTVTGDSSAESTSSFEEVSKDDI